MNHKMADTFEAEVDPLALHEGDSVIIDTHKVTNENHRIKQELFIVEHIKIEADVLQNIDVNYGFTNSEETKSNNYINENDLKSLISNSFHISSIENTIETNCIGSSGTPVRGDTQHAKIVSGMAHTIPNFICKEQEKILSKEAYSKIYKKKPYKNIVYLCEECNRRFSDFPDFSRHFNDVHKESNNFQCLECNKHYSSVNILQKHINTQHSGVNYCRCEICHLMFPYFGTLRNHIKSKHMNIDLAQNKADSIRKEDKVHTCQECGKKICHKRGLKRHLNDVHEKIQNFMCEQCGHRFFNISTLNNHIRSVHGKMKNYDCKECDKRFSWNGGLNRHVKVAHKGEMQKCKDCDKAFTQVPNLRRHIRIVHRKISHK